MKHLFAAAILLAASVLPAWAQIIPDDPIFLLPVNNPEQICRLHPVMDDVGIFIPPSSEISDPLAVRSSTINVTFIDGDVSEPWPQAAKDAFNYAAAIWENHLDSPVPIEIDANWSNLGGCDLMSGVTLGSAGPTLVATWGGSPIANTTYPIGLVNAIFGSDQAPAAADVTSNFNKDCDDVASDLWYFGTDGNVPSGKIDFVTVVLHELGHGLGFAGSASYDDGVNDTGSGGSNGNECNGSAGAGCFSNPPNVYDRFTVDASTGGTSMLDTGSYPDDSATLGTAFTSSVVHFESSSVLANNGGVAAPLFGPSPWEGGSSYSHFDESSYNGSPHAMMTPYLSSQEANHSPGALTCAVFQDIGWPVGPDCLSLLPVELTRFEAVAQGRTIELIWETQNETNNAGFEVEMKGARGSFEPIQFITGAGTTNEKRVYRHQLTVPGAGLYTFRLKQIDFDGGFSRSAVVNVRVQLKEAFEMSPAYPNPFNPTSNFDLTVASTQNVNIELVDATGRIVKNLFEGVLLGESQHTFTIEASDLSSGVYWIRVAGNTFATHSPVIFQK